jgi:hypothetical protein
MALVDGAHRFRAAVIRRVQVGDQVTNGGGHDQQITRPFLTRVPLTLSTPKSGRFSV